MFSKYKNIRPAVHILIWAAYFSGMLLPAMVTTTLAGRAYFITHFIILIVATYVNTLFLVKKYFIPERYKAYIYSLLAVWVCGVIAVWLSGVLLHYPYKPEKFVSMTIGAAVGFTMEFFLFVAFKAAKEWYLKSQQAKEMEFEKIQSELNLLRSQLDAHFIFNTLNNLYLLVLNKSDKAPDAVLKLSDLLSYTIYESHQDRVELSKELGFIENYINLQKLRLDNTQVVHYEVIGDSKGVIEPLIIFNFIENVFKHADGVVTIDGEHYYAYIRITIKQGSLVLTTMNGRSAESKMPESGNDRKGVGMANTTRRLDLAYQNRYQLDIDNTEEAYFLTLIIKEL